MLMSRIGIGRVLIVIIALLALAACDLQTDGLANAVEVSSPVPTAGSTRQITPLPSLTPTAKPTAAPTATPTPVRPALAAIQQSLREDGELVISNVQAPQPCWLVVYSDPGGPGDILGYTAIEKGESKDVPVFVDPYRATQTLHVALHEDAGEPGLFEYPGSDKPMEAAGKPVATKFGINLRVLLPSIAISSQEITRDGARVTVDQVTADGPGWLVVHADDQDELGPVLGQMPVSEGTNENIVVHFDWRQATAQMHAVLYEDRGIVGSFEPIESDRPATLNGEPIVAPFTATLPVDVFVINQPVKDQVIVERAVTNSPGWIAVYGDFSGLTSDLLGYAPLEAGINEQITITLTNNNVTPILHIMVHEDVETIGEFEYPGPDRPILNENRMLLFSFKTDTGNYLVTRDQVVGAGGEVQVPLVVTDLETWLVVYTDEEGDPATIIGRTALEPGVHRDVTINVDRANVSDTLYVGLHQDGGEINVFEYPEGPDIPLRWGRTFIRSPFTVLLDRVAFGGRIQ